MPRNIRPICVEGNIAHITLTKGYAAVIDAADVPLVDQWNWCAHVICRKDGTVSIVYAVRHGVKPNGKRGETLMHRVIACTPEGMHTDHASSNGLDNRRANLRTATVAQNQHNGRIRADNKSGVKGVSWVKRERKWLARITSHRKVYELGYFTTVDAAAAAYAEASARLHGEFGRLA